MTAAITDRYLEAFERASGNGGSAAPDWLRDLRRNAIARFAEVGFPSSRQEEWRFTSVREIADQTFVPAPAVAGTEAMVRPFALGTGPRLVFVNGRYDASLSATDGLPEGTVVMPLHEALGSHDVEVHEHLTRYVPSDVNGFTALNAAFAADGAFIMVPDGAVVDGVIQTVFLTTDGETADPFLTHPRNLVVVGKGAEVQFAETYAGRSGMPYFTNAVTEIVVGEGARADCYRLQSEAPSAFHVATTHSSQDGQSGYAMHAVALGARLARHDVKMVLAGEGSEGILNGLYIVGDRQHVDHQTLIEHAKPHCESHEYFNGILDDSAHSVFSGRIVVRPGAQKTDSKQTNNNLLLSDTARADSQPQLEIYADDVRCTHGATLGPLDPNAQFYLQSRGIEAEAARQMLTFGFGLEIVDRMRPPVRDHVEELVRARLRALSAPATQPV